MANQVLYICTKGLGNIVCFIQHAIDLLDPPVVLPDMGKESEWNLEQLVFDMQPREIYRSNSAPKAVCGSWFV